jgi:AraC-like DNA-binding protein
MSAPQYAELPAPPPLDALVHCFWFLRGSLAGAPAQPVLPDGRMEIILHLAEPFAEVGPDGVARGQAEALLAGQLTAPITLMPRGPADVIGIRFRTEAARSMLGVSAMAVTGRVEPLAATDPKLAGRLMAAATRGRGGAMARGPGARRHGGNEALVEALSTVLLRFVVAEPSALVREAVREMARPGGTPLRELAGKLGVTLRTLERRVTADTGLGPKPLQRVLRFRSALRLLEQTPRGQWSGAAIGAGYYDQAHMIREFRGFAGMPPSEYFGAEVPLSRAIQGL